MLRILKTLLFLCVMAASTSVSAQSIARPFYCSDCLFQGVGMPASPDVRNFIGITVNQYRPQYASSRNALGWAQGATIIVCNGSSCVEFTYRTGFWTQTSPEKPNENKPGDYTNDEPPLIPNPAQAGGAPGDGNGGATGTGGPNTGIGVGAGVCFGLGCYGEVGGIRQV